MVKILKEDFELRTTYGSQIPRRLRMHFKTKKLNRKYAYDLCAAVVTV